MEADTCPAGEGVADGVEAVEGGTEEEALEDPEVEALLRESEEGVAEAALCRKGVEQNMTKRK